jgi:hypothetical protein
VSLFNPTPYKCFAISRRLCFASTLFISHVCNIETVPPSTSRFNPADFPHCSPLNGGVTIVVPGRFLLFPAPAADFPPGCLWADDGPGGKRQFGPGFCSLLLAEMGAAVVVGLDGARCASRHSAVSVNHCPTDLILPASDLQHPQRHPLPRPCAIHTPPLKPSSPSPIASPHRASTTARRVLHVQVRRGALRRGGHPSRRPLPRPIRRRRRYAPGPGPSSDSHFRRRDC